MLDRVFIVSLDTGLLIFEAQYGSKSSVEPMKLSSLFYSITKLALSQPNRSSVGLDERNLIKIQKGNQSIFLCPFQKKNLTYSLITVFSRASDSFSKMFHFLFIQIYINLQESSLQVVDNKLKKQLKAIINKSIKESFQHYLSLLMNHSLLSNLCCYGLHYQQASSSQNQLSSNKPSSAPTITTDDSHNQNSNLSAPTTLPLEETRGRPSPTKHKDSDDKSNFTTDSTAFPLFFCCYSKLNKVHNCEDSAPKASSVDEFESPIPKGTPFTLLHLHSSHNREDIRHLDQVLLPAINQNISNLFPNQTSNENESSLIYGEFLLNQHTGQFIIPDSKPTLLSEGDKAVGVFSYQNYAWIIQKETFSRREEIESMPFHDIITFILTLRLCHQQQLIAEIQ